MCTNPEPSAPGAIPARLSRLGRTPALSLSQAPSSWPVPIMARSLRLSTLRHSEEGRTTCLCLNGHIGRVPFLRARARARARNGKSTRFSRNWPSVRNEHEHEYLCSFSITFVLVLDVRVRKKPNRSDFARLVLESEPSCEGIFRARTITTFGDRFVLVLHNRTCGVKRNGRNLVDEHGLREMCSCAYLFHTTRAKRKLRARARARARRKGTRP